MCVLQMHIIDVTQYATIRKESYGADIIHRNTLRYGGQYLNIVQYISRTSSKCAYTQLL